MQGLSIQGLSIQGLSVQGLSVQELSVQGLAVQGLAVQGLAVRHAHAGTGNSTMDKLPANAYGYSHHQYSHISKASPTAQ